MCGRVQASKRTPPSPIAHSQVKKKIQKYRNTFIQRRTMLLSEVHMGLVMSAARGGMCKDQERQSQAKASSLKRSDL